MQPISYTYALIIIIIITIIIQANILNLISQFDWISHHDKFKISQIIVIGLNYVKKCQTWFCRRADY